MDGVLREVVKKFTIEREDLKKGIRSLLGNKNRDTEKTEEQDVMAITGRRCFSFGMKNFYKNWKEIFGTDLIFEYEPLGILD